MGWGVWVSKGGCIMDMRDFSSIKLLVSKAAFLAFMIFSWLRLSHFLLTHPDNQIFLVLSKTVVGYWLFLHIIFPFQWMGTCTVIPEQCWLFPLISATAAVSHAFACGSAAVSDPALCMDSGSSVCCVMRHVLLLVCWGDLLSPLL